MCDERRQPTASR